MGCKLIMGKRLIARSSTQKQVMTMKKYITPAVQVTETEAASMMAVSIQNGTADPGKPVLSKENNEEDWNIWE